MGSYSGESIKFDERQYGTVGYLTTLLDEANREKQILLNKQKTLELECSKSQSEAKKWKESLRIIADMLKEFSDNDFNVCDEDKFLIKYKLIPYLNELME